MATNVSDNVKSQMRKGFLEYSVLLSLEKGEAYALDIMETLSKGGFEIVEGTLYPLLTRLKNNGLLGYNWKESTQGPPRKYYCLTEDGSAALAEMETDYKEITDMIKFIKNCSKTE